MTTITDLPTVALSLRQPWAWLVIHGGKDIENRVTRWKRRGPFLVHAAKGMTRAEYDAAITFTRRVAPRLVVPAFDALERGGIIGRASIVDVVRPCLTAERYTPDGFPACECGRRWHMGNQYGYVLRDVAPLPFVRCRGMLGFFEVSDWARRELRGGR